MRDRREERRQQLRSELIARLERVRGELSDAEFEELVTSVEQTAARFAEIESRRYPPSPKPTEPVDPTD